MEARTHDESSDNLTARLWADFGRGHDIALPTEWRAPVIFASPHSGARYPADLTNGSPLSLTQLRRNEDAFVDKLFASVPSIGAPLLSARFPRCYVDVNRPADDLLPHMRPHDALSASGPLTPDSTAYRASLGLGVIPLIISEHLSIYRHPPSRAEIMARLDALYHPYHDALAMLIRRARARFGQALLIDCHSMPGFAPGSPRRTGALRRRSNTRRADIILGDGHGHTASDYHMNLVQHAFERLGYHVTRNHPYAGGYSTLRYGASEPGIEAIQIEMNRDLYLNPITLAPKPGYTELVSDISNVCIEIIDGLAIEAIPHAAE